MMAQQHEDYLKALLDRLDGRPIDDISEEDLSRLEAADEREYLGENVYGCRVPDCATRYTAILLSGKLTVMSSDVITGEQPCTDY